MILQDFSPTSLSAIKTALTPRLLSYYQGHAPDFSDLQLENFVWNLQICRAFYTPCHLAEVLLRNAAVARLEDRFGQGWTSESSFRKTLPLRLRQEFEAVAKIGVASDRVCQRLSLGFWCHIFSASYRDILWRGFLQSSFPNMPPGSELLELHRRVQRFRLFRNRIFHHHPIYHQSPTAEFQNIDCLVGWRCKETQLLLRRLSDVSRVINQRPRSKAERS